jgi:hypothetical protein
VNAEAAKGLRRADHLPRSRFLLPKNASVTLLRFPRSAAFLFATVQVFPKMMEKEGPVVGFHRFHTLLHGLGREVLDVLEMNGGGDLAFGALAWGVVAPQVTEGRLCSPRRA